MRKSAPMIVFCLISLTLLPNIGHSSLIDAYYSEARSNDLGDIVHPLSKSGNLQNGKMPAWNNRLQSEQIRFIKDYQHVNSLAELLKKFKGKPVFIDLWASWCEPCLQEFKFSHVLYNFLRKRNIEIIYISFDTDAQDSGWENSIKKFKLCGNHIRANKSLQDDITTLIWGTKNAYSIPHYMLFDKQGIVINKSELNPSGGDLLYNNLKKVM